MLSFTAYVTLAMNAPQQVSSRRSLIVRLVIAVLPRSWRERNLRHELWFHGSTDLFPRILKTNTR